MLNPQEQNKSVCPNCGYCDKCGRSNSPQFSPYLPPYYPYIVYSETPNITWTSTGSTSTYQAGQANNC